MHYSVLVFWFGMGGFVVSIVGMAALDRQPLFAGWETKEWLLSVMVALVGILGSILMTKAVCWVTPSKVTAATSIHGAETGIFPNLVLHVCKSNLTPTGQRCYLSAPR